MSLKASFKQGLEPSLLSRERPFGGFVFMMPYPGSFSTPKLPKQIKSLKMQRKQRSLCAEIVG